MSDAVFRSPMSDLLPGEIPFPQGYLMYVGSANVAEPSQGVDVRPVIGWVACQCRKTYERKGVLNEYACTDLVPVRPGGEPVGDCRSTLIDLGYVSEYGTTAEEARSRTRQAACDRWNERKSEEAAQPAA